MRLAGVEMSRFDILKNKDVLGAALLSSMGVGILAVGQRYDVGTLVHMGAGFVPVVLGTLILLVGLALAVTAVVSAKGAAPAGSRPQSSPWRGWLCLLAAVFAFVLLGSHGGLVPASLASIFISAMGDRTNSVKSSALLATILTVFGVAVFHYGLQIQLPLFQWY